MTGDQIDNVVAQFTRAAQLASKAGFDGVEIHAGRECLFPDSEQTEYWWFS
jgi:2,4-dienoyl-CoA reductase-like NADH-dependent reductase (Old Yellow Enzyme family)